MKHISNEIYRVNTAEAILGNILLVDNKLIVQFSNLIIDKNGNDAFLHNEGIAFLNFCFVVFEDVETLTFDYKKSMSLMDAENRECYGGEHYLTGEYSEFWISFKSGKIGLIEESEFINYPRFLSKQEKIDLIIRKPITESVLKDFGVL